MKLQLSTAALGFAGILSGCVSSGLPTENVVQANQYAALNRTIGSFGEEFENITPITTDQLPGRASMTGQFMAGTDDNDITVVGDATITADFQNGGNLTGTAINFNEYQLSSGCYVGADESCTSTLEQSIDGELDLTGVITGVEFTLNSTGTLSGVNEAGQTETAAVNLRGDGVFFELDEVFTAIATQEGSITLTSPGDSETVAGYGLLIVQ